MPNTILVGAQWGDEGKGKIIDYLTERADIVARSQGGNNAGHTVIVGKDKYVLHLLPSGILRKDKVCVIGNGVVIDPVDLVREIEGLRARKIPVNKNLVISDCAHVVLPYHRQIDELREHAKGRRKIGTTKRGIGPCYGDKVERTGLRMGDLLDDDNLLKKLKNRIRENNRTLKAMGGKPVNFQQVSAAYLVAAKKLRPFITNTVVYLHEAIQAKKRILFEGAQGTFLDLDHGTYPYVTSSNTTAGGACTGTGVPPHRIDRVMGVMKAYTTRVGEGPFPSESAELSDRLHEMGREFGSTTGRARRCGWFDAVATRYATMVNGIDELAVTNLDGLDALKTIKICVAYKVGKKLVAVPPSDLSELERATPVYLELPGWQQSTADVRSFDQLPARARTYLKKICSLTGARLTLASVGPDRDQTMVVP
ncbi:MAG: adenylosuccinate synthase [Terrimicrobiaceae bacterium]